MPSRPSTAFLAILTCVSLASAPTLHAQHVSSAIELMLGTLGEPSRESSAAAGVIGDDMVDSLEASLTPGSSAVIALMRDRWAEDFQRGLEAARARAVMTSLIDQDTEDETP
jgi:hypothetical protein